MGPIREVFLVSGMGCKACVQKIEDALGRTEGIMDAEVDLENKKLSVAYEPKIIDAKKIFNLVQELGYELKKEAP